MTFNEFKRYIEEITDLEVSERDSEINISVTQLKGEMNSRGILLSTTTLQRISEFFYSEYEARSNFVKNILIASAGKLDLSSSSDLVTEVKTLFQNISGSEEKKLKGMYDNASSQVRSGLQNVSFMNQVDEKLFQKIEALLKKNNIYIEFEYKSCCEAKSSGKDVLVLTPNIYGIGIDLKELWGRIFRA